MRPLNTPPLHYPYTILYHSYTTLTLPLYHPYTTLTPPLYHPYTALIPPLNHPCTTLTPLLHHHITSNRVVSLNSSTLGALPKEQFSSSSVRAKYLPHTVNTQHTGNTHNTGNTPAGNTQLLLVATDTVVITAATPPSPSPPTLNCLK